VTKVGFVRTTLALRYEPTATAVAGSMATHVSGSHLTEEEAVRNRSSWIRQGGEVRAVFGSLIVDPHPYGSV
jgi:hypothetical protein